MLNLVCKVITHSFVLRILYSCTCVIVPFQSAANKKLLELSITLMDGTNHSILVDPNTTSRDLASKLAESINLQDRFGFSIYIAIYDKVRATRNPVISTKSQITTLLKLEKLIKP